MRRLVLTMTAVAALGAVQVLGAETPFSFVGVAHAEALSSFWQNKIKKLATNIDKSRQNLAANGDALRGDAFKANQFKGRIENYANSLSKAPPSTDPIMAAAQERLALLRSEFNAMMAGGAAPAPAAAAAPAQAAPAAPAASTATQTPAASAPAASPAASNVRPLVSGERVRVKKLIRDMGNVLGAITTEGPSLYQDPAEYNAAVKRFTQFTDALKKYPQADDPDVKAARETYMALRGKLVPELARGEEQQKILGDVFGNLRAIENRDADAPVPPRLQPPFTEADVKRWADASRIARDAAQKDYKYIQDIAPIAYLPDFTKSGRKAEFGGKDLPRILGNAENRYKSTLAGYGIAQRNIETALEQMQNQILDPHAGMHAEELARIRKTFDDMIPVAQSAVYLEGGLGRPTEEAEKGVEAIRTQRAEFEAGREAAIDAVRMPEPVSTDAERLAIAKQILETERYEFGEYGPIILNTKEILEKSREESEIEIDDVDFFGGEIRMSGTKETTTWTWEEFQFATVLREPGTDLWRITYIKPKKFTSGASTTPIGNWISGGVVETDLIREENIGK